MALSPEQVEKLKQARDKAHRLWSRAYDMPRPDPYDPNSVWAEFQNRAAEIRDLIDGVWARQ